MKETITKERFIENVRTIERLDQFECDGWCALFDYLEQIEEDCDIEIECDIIAFCCGYERFESIDEYNMAYWEECDTLDDVRKKTTVIEIPGSKAFIIQQY